MTTKQKILVQFYGVVVHLFVCMYLLSAHFTMHLHGEIKIKPFYNYWLVRTSNKQQKMGIEEPQRAVH